MCENQMGTRPATQSRDLASAVEVSEAGSSMFEGKRQPAVYILASPNRRAIYVGVTTNLERRLIEHRQGLVEHTAQYNIRCLVYVEAHETAPDAIAREKQIKRWRREKKVALIDSINPEWEDLAPEART